MTPRGVLFVATLSVISMGSMSAIGQSCPSGCTPKPNGKIGPTGTRVSIGFGTGLSADDIAAFREGIEMWNSHFLATWKDMWFTSSGVGPPEIMVRIDPADMSGGARNDTNTYGNGTIWVSPKYLNQNKDAFWRHLIAHELGHSLGLANVTNACEGSALMYANITVSGPFLSRVPGCEVRALDGRYTEESACTMTCPLPCTGTPPVCDTTPDTSGGYQCPFSQCSPLVLDLNGDGIHTTGADDPISFDLTGDGQPERLGWTDPATEEAFLWIDLDHNGRVDDGRELFGQGTILESGNVARDGFEALAQYDHPSLGGNADGRISDQDPIWARLRLWVDANHDGVCTARERGPIAEYGVVEIRLAYTVHNEVDLNRNVHRLRGSYIRWIRGGGKPRLERFALNDVFFASVAPE